MTSERMTFAVTMMKISTSSLSSCILEMSSAKTSAAPLPFTSAPSAVPPAKRKKSPHMRFFSAYSQVTTFFFFPSFRKNMSMPKKRKM